MGTDILIVDDEDDIRKLIKGILEDEGYSTRQANGSLKAYAELENRVPDIMILDIWLQGSDQDGMDILKKVRTMHPQLPVIMISGHGTIETAVSAIKIGAYDFIEKPFKSDRLLLMIERALEVSRLKTENAALKERKDAPVELIGKCSAFQAAIQAIEKAAPANSRVFFTGEAGTGKELAARHLHRLSPRKDKPFVVVNCGLPSAEEFEQALFGYEGPHGLVRGMLENAQGGTLLLDDIARMPLESQGKLVRVLQEQKFYRLNSQDPISIDIRFLAASARNVKDAIAQGDLREDLFYRLNVVPISIPSLNARKEDIPALANFFLNMHARQTGQVALELGPSAIVALQDYDWPGNVRQLKNVMEWVIIMRGAEEGVLEKSHLPPEITGEAVRGGNEPRSASIQDYLTYPLREAREAFERDYLERQLSRFGHNISKTASFVGMERSALHRKLKSLDIGGNSADKADAEGALDLKKAV